MMPPTSDKQLPLACPTCGELDHAPNVLRYPGGQRFAACQCPNRHDYYYKWVVS